MPRHQERVITKRTVDALSVEHRDAENGGDKLVHGSGGISQLRAE